MRTIVVRNVHQALPEGCWQLKEFGVLDDSRNGPVKVLPVPLTTIYLRPEERVMFHPERDANPFFHFFESLWMLAGRNDVEFLTFFNSGMVNYSDDGETFNAAYGHRWRNHFGGDQLRVIIRALSADPACRRQVLGMWDPRHDLGLETKDAPCNTQAYFQVDLDGKLQMMVTNRSNDLIWGAYGANAVHFSFLQEYVASSLKREVGLYYQTSFNTHYYLEPHQELVEKLADKAAMPPASEERCPYSREQIQNTVPLMSIQPGRWNRELDTFMKMFDTVEYVDPFFQHVAVPMYQAYIAFKSPSPTRIDDALQYVGGCAAQDWMIACKEWLVRRKR